MVLINSYNHSLQMHIIPSNYSQIVHLWYGDRRPTSAARTGARPMLNCQSPNKPDRGLGLPASAARNDLTQPRTSSRYGLMFWALSWGYWPEKRLTPDDMIYFLSEGGVFHTQTCPYYEQHNISLLQTLHNNTISS